jgi:glycosyltransferase involved in cell wall biosynthesis
VPSEKMQPMNPLVSVVICNYNYGQLLGEAIASALTQSYGNVEVIVVDDGSKDNSREVLEKYQSKVTCLYTRHQGQAMALWAGVKISHGDIICFLDSDDVWFPTKIEEIVAVFRKREDVGWSRHKLAVSDSTLKPLGASVPHFSKSGPIVANPHMYLERTVTTCTSALSLRRAPAIRAFARLEELLKKGGHDGGADGLYDADAYLLTLIGTSPVRGFSLDRILGYYRRHGQQQFIGTAGVLPMLRRQIEVGRAISRIWSVEMGRIGEGSHIFKHLLVVKALQGRSTWDADRLRLWLQGLRVALQLVCRDTTLGLRQATALTFAYVAPAAWTNRVLVRQGYSLTPSSGPRPEGLG